MKSVAMRGSVMAAVASIFVLSYGITAPVHAQQTAALAANPELAAKGAWDPATTYVIDDIVTSRGSTWRSKRNNNTGRVPGQTRPSTAAYWELFARGFNPTGAWLNTTKYQPDDVVIHQGQTWRAKRTIAAGGAPPTAGANWELLAARGAMGVQGEQGPAGPNTGIGMGTQNAPAISFNNDPNTGIYSPSDGHIAIVENGALVLHNTGTTNTALGRNAMGENSNVGFGNTGIGAAALFAVTSAGQDNTAVGHSALVANTDGGNNTAVGKNALSSNVSASNNTAIGRAALAGNTTGALNTAVGASALSQNSTGVSNVAIGSSALGANTSGSGNTAIGSAALSSNQTASNNVAVGEGALANSTTGSNTAIGHQALQAQTSGYDNTAVGWSALMSNTGGQFNVAIGNEALGSSSTGSSNIAIGAAAGYFATAPGSSIFIGNSGLAADTATIKIGAQGTQTTAFMAGITGVNVANEAAVAINTSTGQLGVVSSSRRYKEDIAPMGDVNATLMKLRPVTFHYTAAHDDGRRKLQYGLIAEEVAESVPDLAAYNAQGTPETVKYHLLPSFLLAGYQAQQKTISAQADRIDALEDRLRRLEALLPQTRAAALQ